MEDLRKANQAEANQVVVPSTVQLEKVPKFYFPKSKKKKEQAVLKEPPFVSNKLPTKKPEERSGQSSKISQSEELNISLEEFLDHNYLSYEKLSVLVKKLHQNKQRERETEKVLLDHISKKLVPVYESEEVKKKHENTSYCGSLYKLINSTSVFNIHYLMIHLDKRNEVGIIDSLVNTMYKNFVNESFFYLPQLCTMITYKTNREVIENFMVDQCVHHIKFTLLVNWLLNSYYENCTDKDNLSAYEKLLQNIEMTLVNGRRANLSSFKKFKAMKSQNDELAIQESIDKESRLNYFSKCTDFYAQLKDMCEKLKKFPRSAVGPSAISRNSVLTNYVYTFNQLLVSQRDEYNLLQKSIVKNFYYGIILPFDDYDSPVDEHNSLIVRIIPDYCFCFSTKARVPVKLCVETVRVGECSEWNDLYLKDSEDITAKLVDIEKSKLLFEQANNITETDDIEAKEDLKRKNFVKNLNSYMEEAMESQNTVKNFGMKLLTNIDKFNLFGSQTKKEKEVLHTTNYNNLEMGKLVNFDHSEVNPFGNKWLDICIQIKMSSPFRNFKTYSVNSFIAKADDDLRQELMAMQIIKRLDEIFKAAKIPLCLRPYEILITSSSSGLIEFLPNTNSIDGCKKKFPKEKNWDLNDFYRAFFDQSFEEAQKNFTESLAAYSLTCYILSIKDRHNGNILIDLDGKIIHIDFGFILGISPGNLNFESAPFKLTKEYVKIMDGLDSGMFEYYKSLIFRGFLELRRNVDELVKIVEIMSKGTIMPCFEKRDVKLVVSQFREKFHELKSDQDFMKLVDELINKSYDNFWTNKYDSFQNYTNEIMI